MLLKLYISDKLFDNADAMGLVFNIWFIKMARVDAGRFDRW